MKTTSRAFTLTELLVVLAIMAIITAIVIVNLSATQAQARDAKRMSDLKQVQVALASYAAANGGKYPTTSNAWRGNCSTYGSMAVTGQDGYIPGLAPLYISVLPRDPRQAEPSRCYLYRSNGTDYMFMAYMTAEGPVPDEFKRAYAPTQASLVVYTPGGANW